MHDFYYTRLLGNESKFKPRPGNRCVDVLDLGVSDLYDANCGRN
jgi:hypothetical protein